MGMKVVLLVDMVSEGFKVPARKKKEGDGNAAMIPCEGPVGGSEIRGGLSSAM